MMAAKTSPETRAEILRLWTDGGWTAAALARKFGITATTIRMMCDPDYAETRRSYINANRRNRPPPSYAKRRNTPSLAKV
jgi:predicted ArsR family transcriptional regulator